MCTRTSGVVALKVYFMCKLPSNLLHMVLREVEIHRQLVHKNIAALYGAFQVGGGTG